MHDDTIAALATPPGRSGIAVIRVSGEKTREILDSLSESPVHWRPREARHRFLVQDERRIAEAIIIFFQQPRSYTGEDVAEISIHGNPFLVETVLNLLFQAGARQALPGEFTFRAFRHGKIDLLQAESVRDLIQSNSLLSSQRHLNGVQGRLSSFIHKIRDFLINMGIEIESAIEFAEDQHLEKPGIREDLGRTREALEKVLGQARYNDLLTQGLKVVIVGKVNVGKSSLFNALLLEDRSITSAIPGTTRDFLREKIFISGFPVELIDVAGLNREVRDEIEALGIEKSLEQIKASDAVIFLLDAAAGIDETDLELFGLIREKKHLSLINKKDLATPGIEQKFGPAFPGESLHLISVKQDPVLEIIHRFFREIVTPIREDSGDFLINQRQQVKLTGLAVQLAKVDELLTRRGGDEIVAEEIRLALDIIGELTGEISREDILQGIFSTFCIGK